MPLNTFEIVTALTIVSIGTIILLYFIVLKRKGWLTEESPSEAAYLCPNPQCKKIFEKPITLTDLSSSPPRAYLACPHCGLDMEKIPAVRAEKHSKDHKIEPEAPSVVKPAPHGEYLPARTEHAESETLVDTKIMDSKASDSHATVDVSRDVEKRISPPEKELTKPSSKPNKAAKRSEDKSQDNRKTCSHFFGYVKTLPKSTPIPEECMWCPLIVKCLTGADEIEA